MEFKKTEIIDTAGQIILQSGIHSLTIKELALKMEAPIAEFSMYFKKDSRILLMLLINLENEIQQLINEVAHSNQSPEVEFQSLFKKLYRLFGQKPYYLSIILSTEVIEQNADMLDIIERIKMKVEIYLLRVINKGKKKKIFHTETRSRLLVNRILGSFRMLMNDHKITSDMIRKIRLLKSNNDAAFNRNKS